MNSNRRARKKNSYLHVFILRDKQAATSYNDLELEIADVLDRIILLADNLSNERMRSAWENKVMFFTKERFKFVQ